MPEWPQKMVAKLLQDEELGEKVSLVHSKLLMRKKISTIKKHSDYVHIRLRGRAYKSNSLILQTLFDESLSNSQRVGYTATKKLGNAVKRNRAKRIMRELIRETLHSYGQKNFNYVLIAKEPIFDTPFDNLKDELIKLLLKNEKNN